MRRWHAQSWAWQVCALLPLPGLPGQQLLSVHLQIPPSQTKQLFAVRAVFNYFGNPINLPPVSAYDTGARPACRSLVTPS